MGIVNVTPDSFSDGGVHFEQDTAFRSALQMIEDGAAILDLGGESTRPGAEPVSTAEEMRRVVPLLEKIRHHAPNVALSVDTMKSDVAAAALEAGADIVNDVTALRHDPQMGPLVAKSGALAILMHMRGEPRTMQQTIDFKDLLGEISTELRTFRDSAVAAGIDPQRIFIDPGIGFGKTFEHNAEILRRCGELREIAPLVIGASRKAFIGNLTGQPAGPKRVAGSLAAVAAAAQGGAEIVRVHDVRETVDFLRVYENVTRRAS